MTMYFAHRSGRGMYVKLYGKGRKGVQQGRYMRGAAAELLSLPEDSTSEIKGGRVVKKQIEKEKPRMDDIVKKLE